MKSNELQKAERQYRTLKDHVQYWTGRKLFWETLIKGASNETDERHIWALGVGYNDASYLVFNYSAQLAILSAEMDLLDAAEDAAAFEGQGNFKVEMTL
jgi:hypothetical protein